MEKYKPTERVQKLRAEAGGRTLSAGITAASFNAVAMQGTGKAVTLIRTYCFIFPASDTFVLTEHQLRLCRIRLRIMTPQTAQRAAFQKDCCSDPRTVVNGESLIIENNTLCFIHKCSSLYLYKLKNTAISASSSPIRISLPHGAGKCPIIKV